MTTVGVIMSGIDSRIVIIGLPQVAAGLGADAEQAIWITQAYVLGSTVALLLIGRVSDVVGRVRIYTSGFGVFTVGSLLVSLGVTPTQVILFRFIQGLGSAILFTNSAAMIVDATPDTELGFFLGINQVAFRMGAMAGLTVSGVILTLFADWRALFYINVPIGIFGTLWARARLREIAKLEKGAPIDWPGFATFTVFISSLLLALTLAAYGLGEERIVLALSAACVLSLVAFVLLELRSKYPLLDLKLLRIREFSGGVVAQLLNAVSFGAVLLLLSLYFQLVLGLDPFKAGLLILPLDLTTVVLGPLSGKLSDKYGHLPFTTGGLAVVSLSLFLFATTDVNTPIPLLIGYMAIFGAGLGIFASPNMSSIMGSVPGDRRGIASAFRATFFNVGFVISLNLAILIMTFTIRYDLISQIISAVNPVAITTADKDLFAAALRNAYFWMGILNTVAIVPSMLRGRRVRANAREPGLPTSLEM
ncbi:MAG TPA: MFS transporter [Thermoplasmata archaeon]|nr:MFS transporter [Thermoplasmata archaeon]